MVKTQTSPTSCPPVGIVPLSPAAPAPQWGGQSLRGGHGGGSEDGDDAATLHAGLSLASHYHQLHPSEAPRAVPITACLVSEHLLQPSWWKCILPSLKGLDHLSPSLSPLPYPTERIALPTPQAWRQQRNPRG